jgi:hypothetical protein
MKPGLPPWLWGLITSVLVIVLFLLDWTTGYELHFFVFYFLPVSLGAWFLNLGATVALAFACAISWSAADFLSGHTYSSIFYAFWNAAIRLLAFLLIGLFINKIKLLLDRERKISQDLHRSLAEIKVLEAILPICAQCKKIRNQEGHWQQLELYIGEHANTKFSHGYCPECAMKILAEAGLLDENPEPSND